MTLAANLSAFVGTAGLTSAGALSTTLTTPVVNSATTLSLQTNNGTTGLYIDASQNVGIGGTTSTWGSGYKSLQIGNSFFGVTGGVTPVMGSNTYNNGTTDVYSTTGAASRYYQTSGTHVWNTASSGTAGATLSFSPVMTLNASGYLGIGTTSPNRPLEAYNSAQAPSLRLSNSGGNQGIEFISNGGYYNWLIGSQYFNVNSLQIAPSTATNGTTFTTPVVTIQQNGSVGIGTTSPSYPLDVSGSIRASTSVVANGGYLWAEGSGIGGSNAGLILDYNGNVQWQIYPVTTAGRLAVTSSGSEWLSITKAGYVGIGQTSPAYNLHVQGSSYVTGASRVNNAQYGFYAGNFINAGTYLHLKTNMPKGSTLMWTIEMVGYDYGANWPIGAMWSGYNYGGSNSTIATGWKDYVDNGTSYANNVYDSSDGYVVIVAQMVNQYFFQFVLNGYMVGEGYFDIAVTAATGSSSNSGAY